MLRLIWDVLGPDSSIELEAPTFYACLAANLVQETEHRSGNPRKVGYYSELLQRPAVWL